MEEQRNRKLTMIDDEDDVMTEEQNRDNIRGGASGSQISSFQNYSSVSTDVFRIAYHLVKSPEGLGDAAGLRRLCSETFPGEAFWRLMTRFVSGESYPKRFVPTAENAKQWEATLCCLGFSARFVKPEPSFGQALSACGFSESRVLQLLRGEDRFAGSRRACQFLASKYQPFDPMQLVELIFEPDGETKAARAIANHYYKFLKRKEK